MHKEPQEPQEEQDLRVFKVRKEQQETKELKVHSDLLVQVVLRALKDHKGLKDREDLRGL